MSSVFADATTAARLLGVSKRSLYRKYVERGLLACHIFWPRRVGKFVVADIEAILKSEQEEGRHAVAIDRRTKIYKTRLLG